MNDGLLKKLNVDLSEKHFYDSNYSADFHMQNFICRIIQLVIHTFVLYMLNSLKKVLAYSVLNWATVELSYCEIELLLSYHNIVIIDIFNE